MLDQNSNSQENRLIFLEEAFRNREKAIQKREKQAKLAAISEDDPEKEAKTKEIEETASPDIIKEKQLTQLIKHIEGRIDNSSIQPKFKKAIRRSLENIIITAEGHVKNQAVDTRRELKSTFANTRIRLATFMRWPVAGTHLKVADLMEAAKQKKALGEAIKAYNQELKKDPKKPHSLIDQITDSTGLKEKDIKALEKAAGKPSPKADTDGVNYLAKALGIKVEAQKPPETKRKKPQSLGAIVEEVVLGKEPEVEEEPPEEKPKKVHKPKKQKKTVKTKAATPKTKKTHKPNKKAPARPEPEPQPEPPVASSEPLTKAEPEAQQPSAQKTELPEPPEIKEPKTKKEEKLKLSPNLNEEQKALLKEAHKTANQLKTLSFADGSDKKNIVDHLIQAQEQTVQDANEISIDNLSSLPEKLRMLPNQIASSKAIIRHQQILAQEVKYPDIVMQISRVAIASNTTATVAETINAHTTMLAQWDKELIELEVPQPFEITGPVFNVYSDMLKQVANAGDYFQHKRSWAEMEPHLTNYDNDILVTYHQGFNAAIDQVSDNHTFKQDIAENVEPRLLLIKQELVTRSTAAIEPEIRKDLEPYEKYLSIQKEDGEISYYLDKDAIDSEVNPYKEHFVVKASKDGNKYYLADPEAFKKLEKTEQEKIINAMTLEARLTAAIYKSQTKIRLKAQEALLEVETKPHLIAYYKANQAMDQGNHVKARELYEEALANISIEDEEFKETADYHIIKQTLVGIAQFDLNQAEQELLKIERNIFRDGRTMFTRGRTFGNKFGVAHLEARNIIDSQKVTLRLARQIIENPNNDIQSLNRAIAALKSVRTIDVEEYAELYGEEPQGNIDIRVQHLAKLGFGRNQIAEIIDQRDRGVGFYASKFGSEDDQEKEYKPVLDAIGSVLLDKGGIKKREEVLAIADQYKEAGFYEAAEQTYDQYFDPIYKAFAIRGNDKENFRRNFAKNKEKVAEMKKQIQKWGEIYKKSFGAELTDEQIAQMKTKLINQAWKQSIQRSITRTFNGEDQQFIDVAAQFDEKERALWATYDDDMLESDRDSWGHLSALTFTNKEAEDFVQTLPYEIIMIFASGGAAGIAGGAAKAGLRATYRKAGGEAFEHVMSLSARQAWKEGALFGMMNTTTRSALATAEFGANSIVFAEAMMLAEAAKTGNYSSLSDAQTRYEAWEHSLMTMGVLRGIGVLGRVKLGIRKGNRLTITEKSLEHLQAQGVRGQAKQIAYTGAADTIALTTMAVAMNPDMTEEEKRTIIRSNAVLSFGIRLGHKTGEKALKTVKEKLKTPELEVEAPKPEIKSPKPKKEVAPKPEEAAPVEAKVKESNKQQEKDQAWQQRESETGKAKEKAVDEAAIESSFAKGEKQKAEKVQQEKDQAWQEREGKKEPTIEEAKKTLEIEGEYTFDSISAAVTKARDKGTTTAQERADAKFVLERDVARRKNAERRAARKKAQEKESQPETKQKVENSEYQSYDINGYSIIVSNRADGASVTVRQKGSAAAKMDQVSVKNGESVPLTFGGEPIGVQVRISQKGKVEAVRTGKAPAQKKAREVVDRRATKAEQETQKAKENVAAKTFKKLANLFTSIKKRVTERKNQLKQISEKEIQAWRTKLTEATKDIPKASLQVAQKLIKSIKEYIDSIQAWEKVSQLAEGFKREKTKKAVQNESVEYQVGKEFTHVVTKRTQDGSYELVYETSKVVGKKGDKYIVETEGVRSEYTPLEMATAFPNAPKVAKPAPTKSPGVAQPNRKMPPLPSQRPTAAKPKPAPKPASKPKPEPKRSKEQEDFIASSKESVKELSDGQVAWVSVKTESGPTLVKGKVVSVNPDSGTVFFTFDKPVTINGKPRSTIHINAKDVVEATKTGKNIESVSHVQKGQEVQVNFDLPTSVHSKTAKVISKNGPEGTIEVELKSPSGGSPQRMSVAAEQVAPIKPGRENQTLDTKSAHLYSIEPGTTMTVSLSGKFSRYQIVIEAGNNGNITIKRIDNSNQNSKTITRKPGELVEFSSLGADGVRVRNLGNGKFTIVLPKSKDKVLVASEKAKQAEPKAPKKTQDPPPPEPPKSAPKAAEAKGPEPKAEPKAAEAKGPEPKAEPKATEAGSKPNPETPGKTPDQKDALQRLEYDNTVFDKNARAQDRIEPPRRKEDGTTERKYVIDAFAGGKVRPGQDGYDAWLARRKIGLDYAMRVLGLPLGQPVNLRQVKREYRRLSNEYHPDKHDSAPKPQQETKAEMFDLITKAYDFIKANFQGNLSEGAVPGHSRARLSPEVSYSYSLGRTGAITLSPSGGVRIVNFKRQGDTITLSHQGKDIGTLQKGESLMIGRSIPALSGYRDVSRSHCIIYNEGNGNIFVKDLTSAYGTVVRTGR